MSVMFCLCECKQEGKDLRLEETIAVTVDDVDGGVIVDADVVGLDADNSAMLLVKLINGQVPVATTGNKK